MQLSFFILLSMLFFPVSAGAQGHHIYCDMADSTAATQRCLKKHLDAAQRRLNKIYGDLEIKLEEESKKQELKDLQQTWLRYRDEECMWEAERTETPSLKRINELSCMARVTDDRADLLAVIATDEESETGVREYGSFPRWMNVLAKDHPEIYWNYGKRSSEDLNCDDDPEQIMVGTILAKQAAVASEEESKQDISYNQEMVLSIVENPATGRPKARLFKFLVSEEDRLDTLCSDNVSTQIEAETVAKIEEGEDSTKEESCNTYLTIKNGSCIPKKIKWDGKNFVLQKPPVSDDKQEEEKKK